MTNLEKIQSLTSEEIVKFISFVEKESVPCRYFEETFYCQCFDDCVGDMCDSCKRKWLDSEVEPGWNFWCRLLSDYGDINT